MFGKMFKRPQIENPSLRRMYAKERAAEEARIRATVRTAEIEKIKARARMDAQRAATPASTRAIRTVSVIGARLGDRIKKMDTEKFEAYVTGVSTDKKEKPA